MRYLLYESNADYVPLEKEVEHLQNFVEMQRLRVGEKASISFEVQGEVGEKQIAPLLFLPLVENGFKHGIKGDTEGAFIKIHLQVTDNQLVFKTENNKGTLDETILDNQSGGVGLENLRRRLDLLYPRKHKLDIVDGVTVFTVVLTIQLQNK
jgi:LytS/YehU family sensor histidine kinase